MENEVNCTNNYQQHNYQGNYNADPTLDAQIAEQQKYFKQYAKMPLIIAVITFAFLTISGISSSIILDSVVPFFIYLLAGAIVGAFEYFIGRIMYSQMILTVLYLQKLNEKK